MATTKKRKATRKKATTKRRTYNRRPVVKTARRKRKVATKKTVFDAMQMGGLILLGLLAGSFGGGMIPLENKALKGGLISLLGFLSASSVMGKGKIIQPILLGIGTIGLYTVAKQFTSIPTLAGSSMSGLLPNSQTTPVMNGLELNGDYTENVTTDYAFYSTPGDYQ